MLFWHFVQFLLKASKEQIYLCYPSIKEKRTQKIWIQIAVKSWKLSIKHIKNSLQELWPSDTAEKKKFNWKTFHIYFYGNWIQPWFYLDKIYSLCPRVLNWIWFTLIQKRRIRWSQQRAGLRMDWEEMNTFTVTQTLKTFLLKCNTDSEDKADLRL